MGRGSLTEGRAPERLSAWVAQRPNLHVCGTAPETAASFDRRLYPRSGLASIRLRMSS
jgi:hypothetical protein